MYVLASYLEPYVTTNENPDVCLLEPFGKCYTNEKLCSKNVCTN